MAGKERGFLYCEKTFSQGTESRVALNINFGITKRRLHVGLLITGTMLPVFGK